MAVSCVCACEPASSWTDGRRGCKAQHAGLGEPRPDSTVPSAETRGPRCGEEIRHRALTTSVARGTLVWPRSVFNPRQLVGVVSIWKRLQGERPGGGTRGPPGWQWCASLSRGQGQSPQPTARCRARMRARQGGGGDLESRLHH